jgi:hypothetical protein
VPWPDQRHDVGRQELRSDEEEATQLSLPGALFRSKKAFSSVLSLDRQIFTEGKTYKKLFREKVPGNPYLTMGLPNIPSPYFVTLCCLKILRLSIVHKHGLRLKMF